MLPETFSGLFLLAIASFVFTSTPFIIISFSQEVQDVLFESGLNFHPGVVKMMLNIGKLIESDMIHDGKTPTSPDKTTLCL
jgi:hypothetical protein